MIHYKAAFIIGLCMLLFSCTFNSGRRNSREDIETAKKVADKFFYELKVGTYEDTYPLYKESFFKTEDATAALYAKYDLKFGSIQAFSVDTCISLCYSGSTDTCNFTVAYDVVRGRGTTREILTMNSDHTRVPKILKYEVLERRK